MRRRRGRSDKAGVGTPPLQPRQHAQLPRLTPECSASHSRAPANPSSPLRRYSAGRGTASE